MGRICGDGGSRCRSDGTVAAYSCPSGAATCQAQRQMLQKPQPPLLSAGSLRRPEHPSQAQLPAWMLRMAASRSNIRFNRAAPFGSPTRRDPRAAHMARRRGVSSKAARGSQSTRGTRLSSPSCGQRRSRMLEHLFIRQTAVPWISSPRAVEAHSLLDAGRSGKAVNFDSVGTALR